MGDIFSKKCAARHHRGCTKAKVKYKILKSATQKPEHTTFDDFDRVAWSSD